MSQMFDGNYHTISAEYNSLNCHESLLQLMFASEESIDRRDYVEIATLPNYTS